MRQTVAISLPEDLKEALDKVCSEEGVTRSDLVRESLKDYLFFRRFKALRAKLLAKAKAQGIYTDEDVFNRIS
jgi:metal-responsive CopG/Arc/MetJ family transcriptional regulator